MLSLGKDLEEILTESKIIAVVGASQKPWRESNGIMMYLMNVGYEVIPVNPAYAEVIGTPCYPTLKGIPKTVDIVDIFRNPNAVIPVVNDAIQMMAKTDWMQLGIINHEAALLATLAGLHVVMDRCIAVEHRHLIRV